MCSIDVNDAFLQVKQPCPMRVEHAGISDKVERCIAGQRCGSLEWFKPAKKYLEEKLDMEACAACPNLFRNNSNVALLMMHVDDFLISGPISWIDNVFLPTMQKEFEVSIEILRRVGYSITFLTREHTMHDDCIVVKQSASHWRDKQRLQQILLRNRTARMLSLRRPCCETLEVPSFILMSFDAGKMVAPQLSQVCCCI